MAVCQELKRDRTSLVLWGTMLAVAGLLVICGRLAPQITPDTTGYCIRGDWAARLSDMRIPFFGFLMEAFSADNYIVLPTICMVVFFASVAFLFFSLRRFGVSGGAALAVALPLLISNPVLLFSGYVHPEILSLAFMISAFACLLRLVVVGGWGMPVLFGLCLGIAYLLKPGFMPMILLMPFVFVALARVSRHPPRRLMSGAAVVFLAGLAPFLAVSTVRWSVVRDFNIVSFGGVTMAGMAGSILTPEIADALPERHRALAQAILDGRERLEAQRLMLPMPLNSKGERSFLSVALGYYDILARNFDSVLYGAVFPQRRPAEEGWVAFNARMQDFALQTLLRAPTSYASWVIGGTMRSVGHMLVGNAAFVLATLLLGVVALLRLFGRGGRSASVADIDWPALVILTLAFTVGSVLPPIMLAFPARRYLDSGGMLLACLPAYGAWRLWREPALRCGEAGAAQ